MTIQRANDAHARPRGDCGGGGTAPLGAVPSGSGVCMAGSARGRAARAARCIAGRSRQPRSWIARAHVSRFPAPAVRSLARAMAQAAVRDRAKCPPLQAKREFTANRRPASERTRSGRHTPQRTRPGRKPRDKTPNRGPKRPKNRLKNMAGYLLYLTPGSDRAPLPQTAWSTLGKGIRGQALSYGDACSGMWLGLA
jgi:hypothetical protein